jgi:D-lactate dehydrogenase
VARKVSGDRVPRVSRTLRPGPGVPEAAAEGGDAPNGNVVYFPSCATRMFGAATRENGMLPTTDAMLELLGGPGSIRWCRRPRRAVLRPAVPVEGVSRGGGARRRPARGAACGLLGGGAHPVVTDASTCAKHMREHPGDRRCSTRPSSCSPRCCRS